MMTSRSRFLQVSTHILVVVNLALSGFEGYSFGRFWEPGWAMVCTVLLALLTTTLIVRIIVEQPGSRRISLTISTKLVVGWTAWAMFTTVPRTTTDVTVFLIGYPLLLAAAHRVVLDSGPMGVARLLALAVATHLFLAAVTVAASSASAFQDGRLALVSLEPNELARIAALGTLGGIWMLRSRRKTDLVVGLISTCTAATTLLLTVSRTSVLGLFISAAVIVASSAHKRLAALALGTGLVLFVIPMSITSDAGELGPASAVAQRSGQDVINLGGRATLWPLVIEKFKEAPVQGIGVGNDRAAVNTLEIGWEPQHTHNLILHLLLTTGLVGTLALIPAVLATVISASAQGNGLALAFGVFIVLNGVSEPVIRVPSFGWFTLAATVFLVACTTGHQTPRADSTLIR